MPWSRTVERGWGSIEPQMRPTWKRGGGSKRRCSSCVGVASLGQRVGLRSEADILDKMQKDVVAMAERGYRLVASDEYDLPIFLVPGKRATYYRVTYELGDPPLTHT